jgi:hypothetical protein
MAFTLNRRLSTLVDSSGQLKTGKIPNDYITGDHIADNVVTTAMLHTGFTLPISSLTSIDTDDVTEGSTNLFYTTARVDSHLSGGTGVTYSSGAISIGQAVATTDNVTFADLTVTGDLTITGDINSYNVTDLDVADKTITVGAGQTESNSGGSGIIIDGSNASILWDETNDQFDFNKGINVDSNTLVVDGTNNRVGILNAAPDVSLDLGSATDGIHMPVGTTAQRPSSPAAGYFRYNSTDGQFEGYTTEWGAIAGSGGASAMETNNFTGDGSTTAFTLSSSVASEDNLIVFIEGIYQNKGDYVASGTTITFDTAPVNGRRIVVQHILSSVAGNSTLYTSLTGDGSTTAFTLSGAPGHENNTQVFMDGVYQQKDSYIVNGTTLTFDAAPANNAEIEVMSFAQTTINAPGSNTVSVAELNLSDGTAGQFITTDGNGTISFASVPAGYTDSDVETYLDGGTSTASFTNARFGGGLLHSNASGGAIGFNRNPADGAYVGNSSLRRFQINGPDPTYGDVFDIQSYNSSGVFQGYVRIQDGNVTISNGNLTLGSIGSSTSSATPTELNLGSLYADSAGSAAKAKLKIYEDSSANIYGLGVSSGTFEYHNSYSAGKHDWYIGTDRKMRITHDGIIDLKTNNTGAIVVPSGTTAQRPTGANGMIRYNTTNSVLEGYIDSGWKPITAGIPSLTTISGLDLWMDVTGGISSTTITDLSGNNRTGTASSTTSKGTVGSNTYMLCNSGNYIEYANGVIPNYSAHVTYFFVSTNVTTLNGHQTYLGQASGSTGYQIIRTGSGNDDWQFYFTNQGNTNLTSVNTGFNVNSTVGNSTQIITFSFGTQANGNLTVYKRTGGTNTSDVFPNNSFPNGNAEHQWVANSNATRLGNSSWANEFFGGGIFAWGIIDHPITSSELDVIYNYYTDKGLGN